MPKPKKPKPEAARKEEAKAKNKGGRPTDYNIEIASLICEMVAGGEKLNRIYAMPNMPKRSTIYQWLAKHQEFAEMYARAQEDRADYFADEIVEIADQEGIDPNDKRVRIDARKWTAAKLRPRRYGDKLELSGDKENPVQVVVTWETSGE